MISPLRWTRSGGQAVFLHHPPQGSAPHSSAPVAAAHAPQESASEKGGLRRNYNPWQKLYSPLLAHFIFKSLPPVHYSKPGQTPCFYISRN